MLKNKDEKDAMFDRFLKLITFCCAIVVIGKILNVVIVYKVLLDFVMFLIVTYFTCCVAFIMKKIPVTNYIFNVIESRAQLYKFQWNKLIKKYQFVGHYNSFSWGGGMTWESNIHKSRWG